MRHRLYLQFYLTIIASLIVFVLLAGALWRFALDAFREETFELAGELAATALPPPAAPESLQQAALERLRQRLPADFALYTSDARLTASVGAPLPAIAASRESAGWTRARGGPTRVLQLDDGRWLIVRLPPRHHYRGLWLAFFLGSIALAVAIGAYPVARRLTRRLERLKSGVEQLGQGDLNARVQVEGQDEVALLAASFNRASERIQELVHSHKMLLANCSHELRTPLTRIRMAVELLKSSADPKRREELEHDIAELDKLIEEILLASRLDAVKKRELNEEVDLLALAAEEAAHYGAPVTGEPVLVRGDPSLLRRMLRNLLENARRYSAHIEVTVGNASDSRAQLEVIDRGPGIPEAEREKIFEPFHRLRNSSETSRGSGLGLALVRQIARQHGGDAECRPAGAEGSRFRVVLPACK
ncbi:MAG TPA: ATP-binding protein [Burkholderiales bacterium]|nr:ATP-binding protein [Burkholderiales bacterium]